MTRTHKSIIHISASLVLCAFSLGANAQTLSLEDCKSKAIAYNKSLSSAKYKFEQTTYDMKSYKANYFPKINLTAIDFYSDASGSFDISGGHLPIYNYVEALGQFVPNVTPNADGSYTLNQYADFPDQSMKWKIKNVFFGSFSIIEPVYTGGKVSTAYSMSKIGVNMAKENIRLTESEVIIQTEEAYYMAIKAKELGDVARKYRDLLNELKKNVDGAFRHGMRTRNDVMKVQVKLNEAELSIQKADNGYRLALMNLCHVIGMPLDSNISIDSNIPNDENGGSVFDGDINNRPEFNILAGKTELAKKNIKLAKSDYLPVVAVGGAYTYANGGEMAGKRLLSGGAYNVGVTVNVPIDIFGGTTNKVRSAKAAYQITQLEQEELNEKMQLELALCKNNVEEAKTELELCKLSLEQAAENMKLSKQQCDVGFETLSDYLESQALWQQSYTNLVQARCQLQLAKLKYRKAAGVL